MLKFLARKKIFITGHTGFKGAWLCRMLINAGAVVTGYSLNPPTEPNLFDICGVNKEINSVIGDIRDLDRLNKAFIMAQPEVVIHLAAQPLVRESYTDPRSTYETNVMGTVNILECVRKSNCVKSMINITTDKVYQNNEWAWGYRENDPLDGYDPYANSKSCSELVTHSYKNSFFIDESVAISTARSGNVLGGGDFAKDRIIPDCVRALENKSSITVRNPHSTRPYQHVLDSLYAYLMVVHRQFLDNKCAGYYNIGPDESDCVTTGKLVDMFCNKWEAITGEQQVWINKCEQGPHEANFLKLDCSKVKAVFGWKPRWNIETTLEQIIVWTKTYFEGGNIISVMDRQINEFLGGNINAR